MNTKLNHVQDWPELAQKANWSGGQLAELCAVSPRTLERHFRRYFAKTPKGWLLEHRHKQAKKFLKNGFSVKETAAILGYKKANHFSQAFKKHFGICPTELALRKPL
jgi:transcriptional regulator GlxA family with amidase domain